MLISNLPPWLRNKAIANREAQHPGSTEDRLSRAFQWQDSPEGRDFWIRAVTRVHLKSTGQADDEIMDSLRATNSFFKRSKAVQQAAHPTYDPADVQALVEALEGVWQYLPGTVATALRKFKSKYPGV